VKFATAGDAARTSLQLTGDMTNKRNILIGAAAAACSMAVLTQASGATSKTETLRYHVKDVSKLLTHVDGTVVRRPPFPEPIAGDVLVINSLDYKGDSRHHAANWTASQTRRCAFTQGEPDCSMTVAIAGSLLSLHGNPGTVVNGTGRYEGATGRVVSVKDTGAGADVVARVKLH
jgi:hypothetical protein